MNSFPFIQCNLEQNCCSPTFNYKLNILSSDGTITQWSDGSGTDPDPGAEATFTVTLAEDIAETTAIITLTATPDTGQTIVSYEIETEPTDGQFEITTDGEVSLASEMSLDREQDSEIIIKIK